VNYCESTPCTYSQSRNVVGETMDDQHHLPEISNNYVEKFINCTVSVIKKSSTRTEEKRKRKKKKKKGR